MIQYNPTQYELDKVAIPSRLIINSQRVVSKYNSPENAVANYQQETVFRKRIIASPIDSLQAIPNTIATSARKALSATQDYQPNVASNRLPWSDISRWLFSGWRYVALGIIGLAGQLGRFGWRNKSLLFMLAAVAVVGSQILVGSVRFGTVDFNWTESNRLKFIVEPIVFCIIAVGLTSSVRLLRGTLRR
jgi:hypothetical protein